MDSDGLVMQPASRILAGVGTNGGGAASEGDAAPPAGAGSVYSSAELSARVDEVLSTVAGLAEVVEGLTDRVEPAGQGPEGGDARREHQSVYRFELYTGKPDDELAEELGRVDEALGELAEWVAWFVRTYRLASVLPACWSAHPLIVEELAGLRVAWAGAWLDGDARHDAVVVWHEQAWRFRDRMTSPVWGAPMCTGQHEEDVTYEEWASAPHGQTAFEQLTRTTQQALVDRANSGSDS